VASFSVNAVSGQQKGRHVIEFQDGSKIVYNLPQVVLQGVLWGERVMNYEGTINFIDEKNGIGAVIYIPPPQDPISWAAWWGGATKLPTDYLGGQVYKLKGNPHTKGDTISNLVGSWLGRIEFDGKIYWSIKANLKKNIPIAAKNPLPSDARYREDLSNLKDGNMDKAHEWKSTLENRQRRDAKLRKEKAGVNITHS